MSWRRLLPQAAVRADAGEWLELGRQRPWRQRLLSPNFIPEAVSRLTAHELPFKGCNARVRKLGWNLNHW